jgi:hypothetical protein
VRVKVREKLTRVVKVKKTVSIVKIFGKEIGDNFKKLICNLQTDEK